MTTETETTAPYSLPANKKVANLIISFMNTLIAQDNDYESDVVEALWLEVWNDHIAAKSPSTRSSYTSFFRNAIRDQFGRDHPALDVIRPLESKYTERTVKAAARSNSGRRPKRKASIENLVLAAQALMNDRKHVIEDGTPVVDANRDFQSALARLWDHELVEIQQSLTLASQVNVASQYRAALRQVGLDDELVMDVVKAPESATEARRQDYLDKVVERNHTIVQFHKWHELLAHVESVLPEPTASWSKIKDEAVELAKTLTKEQATQIGTALLLITGRRSFEIFCQGAFEPAPMELDYGTIDLGQHAALGKVYHNWQLIFFGQAKTRGRAGTKFDTGYVIPILAPAKTVYFAHFALKLCESGQEWSEMTAPEFRNDMLLNNPSCLLPFARSAIYHKFWPVAPITATPAELEASNLVNHNIRSLYTEIADTHFRRKNMSKNAFICQILGHGETDLNTSHSYMRYNLPDMKPQAYGKRSKSRLVQKIIAEAAKRFNITPTDSTDTD
ncbi:telomere resolvase [Brucella sp. HL-2]|nr:telomere resolvase [Brucella sp. HL-2]MCV9909590.1 telomere resolvase [Brucella sp. HL-2]